MTLRFFFLRTHFYTIKSPRPKKNKKLQHKVILKIFFQNLRREFLTTTLVINLQQANQKQRKIKDQERFGLKCHLGSGAESHHSGDKLTEVGTVPLSWPPPPDHLEQPQRKQTPPHTFQLHLGSHKVRTHNQPTYKTISEASM